MNKNTVTHYKNYCIFLIYIYIYNARLRLKPVGVFSLLLMQDNVGEGEYWRDDGESEG